MKIVQGTPPNFDDIVRVFPAANRKGVIFTFGETVYINEASFAGEPEMPIQLKVHESVHIQQQIKEGPNNWWKKYLKDAKFRLHEELVAHKAEYRCLKALDRNLARRYLPFIAERLASPLYGGVVSVKEARKLIRG